MRLHDYIIGSPKHLVQILHIQHSLQMVLFISIRVFFCLLFVGYGIKVNEDICSYFDVLFDT